MTQKEELLERIATMAITVRRAQKNYFANRRNLQSVIAQEKELDKLLDAYELGCSTHSVYPPCDED